MRPKKICFNLANNINLLSVTVYLRFCGFFIIWFEVEVLPVLSRYFLKKNTHGPIISDNLKRSKWHRLPRGGLSLAFNYTVIFAINNRPKKSRSIVAPAQYIKIDCFFITLFYLSILLPLLNV
jgi:hypothetical protein